MVEVINLEKLSNDGYKQPANDPNESTPDNITHCQLRYNTFTSSYVIQGVAVTGSSSTFEFTIASTLGYSLFKLYTSTDGTTYTEKKSYGGSLGKTINLTQTTERFLLLRMRQAGTSAPTTTIQNTFTEATIDYSDYNSAGVYSVYFSNTFLNNTLCSMPPQVLTQDSFISVPIGFIYLVNYGVSDMTFVTVDLNGVPADDLIFPDANGATNISLPVKLINIV